jgi:NADPH2:quinone reductase
VQIAAQLGAKIYATTSTEAKAQVARDRGATAAFLYDDGRFADAARANRRAGSWRSPVLCR